MNSNENFIVNSKFVNLPEWKLGIGGQIRIDFFM